MSKELLLELQCYIFVFDKGCEPNDLAREDLIEFVRLKRLVDKYENQYLC